MINNRTLAIAAVLALTVPAVGAAAPVYFNPLTEQLVEGHTVFAVLEVVDKTTREKNHFAAAVAVLVRENIQVRELQRFPGVLWFNDQYLVNPWNTEDSPDEHMRYPCGGAVLAVNQGSPDPRVMLGPGTDVIVNTGAGNTVVGVGNATDNATSGFIGGQPAGDSDGFGEEHGDDRLSTGTYNNSNTGYAWLGNVDAYADPTNGTVAVGGYTDTFHYVESYLITDPNDHMWQIDVYEGNTRQYLDGSSVTNPVPFKVWAVNVLGSPVFVPDLGESCPPVVDTVSQVVEGAGGPSLPGAFTPYRDDPILGYQEPSDNNFCYNGVANTGQCDLTDPSPTSPVRLYNALLYFKLEHLTVAGANRDHAAGSTDTNGCQVGTEWECPGDDNAEGNSHPFHPDDSGATVVEAEACPETYYVAGGEKSNHGGSTTADSDVWYDGEARYNGKGYCDKLHATRNVDLYFSGEGRPLQPLVPKFAITDLQGSSAPFHCHNFAATNPDCAASHIAP